jgi:DNA-binding GntR family transcriptional regulator
MVKTDEIYQVLRKEILEVQLAPDTPLRLSTLCENHQITVTPLREALARLERERLVQHAPNKGFVVAPVSAVELLDLTKTKSCIEINLLRESMSFGDAAWEAKVVAAHYRLSQEQSFLDAENNQDAFTKWALSHEEFHDSLLCANRSPWLFRFYRQVTEHMRRHGRALRYTNSTIHPKTALAALQASQALQKSSSLTLHTELKDTVINRQYEKAEMLLIEHNKLTILAYQELGILYEDVI